MHIKRVWISNFRSIYYADLRVDPYTILVGENDAGKSNVLRALDLFFDPDRQISEDNFSHHAANRLIIIKVRLANIPAIHRQRLGLEKDEDEATVHFRYSIASGRVYKIDGRAIPIDVIRMIFRRFFIYVPPIRDVAEHLSLEDGEQYRAAIDEMLSRISDHRRQSARRSAEGGFQPINRLLQRELSNLTSAIKQFAPTIEPRFSLSGDLIEILKLMRLELLDQSYPASTRVDHKGQGLHSLVVLALYAHAIQRRINGGVIAVEEPELHLHPNLQRHYVVLMRRLSHSKRVQIMCTTHSPFLINQIDLRRTAKVQKDHGITRIVQPSSVYIDTDFKILEKNLTSLWGELLLARAVILVEGASEHHSLPVWASKTWITRARSQATCTFASHSIVVYPVGSASNFANYLLFLRQFRMVVLDFRV